MRILAPLLTAAIGLALACGPASDDRYRDRLFPLVPGAIWDYRTNDATGAPGARTVRVLGREGGYLVLETRENGVVSQTWLEETPLVLAVREVQQGPGERSQELRYEPGALRALSGADVRAGQVFERSWIRERDGLREPVSARWTIEAVGVTVRGDAGTFEEAVRIRRTQSDGGDTVLWYAPGVGLVRSEGDEQLELVHWALP